VARDSLVGQVLAAQTVENDRDARKGKKKTTTEHETVNERPPFPVGDVHLPVLSRRAKKETCFNTSRPIRRFPKGTEFSALRRATRPRGR